MTKMLEVLSSNPLGRLFYKKYFSFPHDMWDPHWGGWDPPVRWGGGWGGWDGGSGGGWDPPVRWGRGRVGAGGTYLSGGVGAGGTHLSGSQQVNITMDPSRQSIDT
jgi:hypothetical protein